MNKIFFVCIIFPLIIFANDTKNALGINQDGQLYYYRNLLSFMDIGIKFEVDLTASAGSYQTLSLDTEPDFVLISLKFHKKIYYFSTFLTLNYLSKNDFYPGYNFNTNDEFTDILSIFNINIGGEYDFKLIKHFHFRPIINIIEFYGDFKNGDGAIKYNPTIKMNVLFKY